MEEEVAGIKEHMTQVKVTEKAAMEFFEGQLNGKKAVVVKSGIGKVNAGLCAQILVDLFGVDVILNTGIAGCLHEDVRIGDIVLSTDLVQHDMDATGFGYPMGQIPRMDTLAFPANETLRETAVRVCKEVNPQIQVFCGRIATGDQFVSSQEVKERIVGQFAAYATEMEGGAIAQAAYLNQVPFLIIRAISDQADGSAPEDYNAFEKQAIEHSVRLTLGMLAQL
jgi:adenosylhomocysteine nucleosidase